MLVEEYVKIINKKYKSKINIEQWILNIIGLSFLFVIPSFFAVSFIFYFFIGYIYISKFLAIMCIPTIIILNKIYSKKIDELIDETIENDDKYLNVYVKEKLMEKFTIKSIVCFIIPVMFAIATF